MMKPYYITTLKKIVELCAFILDSRFTAKPIRLLLVFTMACTSFSLKAQTNFLPGFIIENENDTIHGLVDFRGDLLNAQRCTFKPNKDSETITYNPFDIKAFRFLDGKYYISKTIDVDETQSKELFLEYLVDGIADLYYYRDKIGNHYLMLLSNGSMIELNNDEEDVYLKGVTYVKNSNQYKGILKSSFSDCYEIQEDINDVFLSHNSLIKITEKYHEYTCSDGKCVVYQKEMPTFKLEFAPYVGLAIFDLNFTNHEKISSKIPIRKSISPLMGLSLESCLPRWNNKLSILVNTEICKDYYYGYYENATQTEFRYLHINDLLLRSNAGLKYTYPRGKVRPTVYFGGGLSVLLFEKSKIIYEHVIDHQVFTDENTDIELSKISNTLDGGFGVEMDREDRTLFLNLSYSISNKKFHFQKQSTMHYWSLGLKTGFYF